MEAVWELELGRHLLTSYLGVSKGCVGPGLPSHLAVMRQFPTTPDALLEQYERRP